jgi:hypothetical protein
MGLARDRPDANRGQLRVDGLDQNAEDALDRVDNICYS